jgi:transcriptional regulator with XRE-family HTH domain
MLWYGGCRWPIVAAAMGANLPVRLRVARGVKRLRRLRGWSQEKLAERVGNTEKHISQVERGKVNVGIDTLSSIASELEVDVAELFRNRSNTARSSVRLITRKDLERIEDALRIVTRVKTGRAKPAS